MKKNYILALGLISSLAFTGCLEKKPKEQAGPEAAAPPTQVGVVVVKKEDFLIKTSLPGRLESFRQAEVRARVSGIILKRDYKEGQEVKAGSVLFEIDPAPYIANRNIAKATLARAKANLANAQDQVKRFSKLIDSHAVSERAHTESILQEMIAKAEVESAKAQLEQTELELGYATVTSPIDGIARRALVTEGALVGHGTPTPLTIVDQIDPIYVKFTQPFSAVSHLRKAVATGEWEGIKPEDIKVHLELSTNNTYSETGKFFFADSAVDLTTDTVEMRALFPNKDKILLPGAYVRVHFTAAKEKNVVLVPRDAVFRSPAGQPMVITVTEDGTAVPKTVETDRLADKNWIVTKGLDGNEKVIVEQTLKVAQQLAGPKLPKVEIVKVLDLEGNVLEETKKTETPAPTVEATVAQEKETAPQQESESPDKK